MSPEPFDPARTYRVRLAATVRLGPVKYLARAGHEMTGAVLNAIVQEHGADALASAEPI